MIPHVEVTQFLSYIGEKKISFKLLFCPSFSSTMAVPLLQTIEIYLIM